MNDVKTEKLTEPVLCSVVRCSSVAAVKITSCRVVDTPQGTVREMVTCFWCSKHHSSVVQNEHETHPAGVRVSYPPSRDI